MTRVPSDLLDRAPEESARLLALGFLTEASAASKRLADPADREALHDFRVAVRRLRSVCRAYRRYLESSVSRKLRRRLRGLTEATNASRDAEVLLAWVRAHRDAAGAEGAAGADWMINRLTERSAAPLGAETGDEWRAVSEILKRRLSVFKTVMHLGRPSRHPPFRRVVGDLITEHVGDLRARLAAVHGRDDGDEAHRARISAKRLRYLLEPLARKGRAVPGFVERLKGLQDLFGELRDVQVLAQEITQSVEEVAAARARRLHGLALEGAPHPAGADTVDEAPGLVVLARLARAEADRLFAQAEAQWLSGRADPFLATVDGFARSLAQRRRGRTTEIERKFLLTALPDRLLEAPASEVAQGWIPGAELHERVRRTRSAKGEVFTRTLKFGNGIRRTEIEEGTTQDVFESLWPLTAGRRVEKRRYEVPDGDLVWEVDQFTDRELVLAEIELPAEDTPVELPGWLRPYVVREVTDESEYVNLNLAK